MILILMCIIFFIPRTRGPSINISSTMDDREYKKYHEEHMMHNTGTSLEECAILISTVPFCVFLSSYFSSYLRKTTSCIFEFVLIILPVILNCTVFSEISHIVFLNIVFLSVIIILIKVDYGNFKNLWNKEYKGKKAFISNYRASTNFISAICILAVDFMVFPKRLAKTESFGFGFMDMGVGCYICSNGFVEKQSATKGQFTKFLKTELILCSLGFLRVLSVKSVDYHEHVSEYGVHWNFFFTLALCRLLSYCIILITSIKNSLYLSIVIGFLHQGLLYLGFQQWVLNNKPRDSFLSANKEGLVSSFGYVSLFFAASALGRHFAANITYKNLLKKLFLMCIITWMGCAFSVKLFNVSRRLCNVGYIFWLLALSLSELILFIMLELCLKSIKKKYKRDFNTEPVILRSINSHGLLFFILSNLLTGLVNLCFQTLLLGKVVSMLLIISYMICLCSATYVLDKKKLFL